MKISHFVLLLGISSVLITGLSTDAVLAQTAQEHIGEGDAHHQQALDAEALEDYEQAAEHHHEAGIQYHNAAMIYEAEEDHDHAAKYHHESGEHHHMAALALEKIEQYEQAAEHHHMAATALEKAGLNQQASEHHKEAAEHHRMAAMNFKSIEDDENFRKHVAHSMMHEGIARHGTEYVLPPKQQMHLTDDASEISCKPGLELIFKSSNNMPACVNPGTAASLVERGFAK